MVKKKTASGDQNTANSDARNRLVLESDTHKKQIFFVMIRVCFIRLKELFLGKHVFYFIYPRDPSFGPKRHTYNCLDQ